MTKGDTVIARAIGEDRGVVAGRRQWPLAYGVTSIVIGLLATG